MLKIDYRFPSSKLQKVSLSQGSATMSHEHQTDVINSVIYIVIFNIAWYSTI